MPHIGYCECAAIEARGCMWREERLRALLSPGRRESVGRNVSRGWLWIWVHKGGIRKREKEGEKNSEPALAVDIVEPMLRLHEGCMSRPSDMLEWLAISSGWTRRG